jgi:hypothetical protein
VCQVGGLSSGAVARFFAGVFDSWSEDFPLHAATLNSRAFRRQSKLSRLLLPSSAYQGRSRFYDLCTPILNNVRPQPGFHPPAHMQQSLRQSILPGVHRDTPRWQASLVTIPSQCCSQRRCRYGSRSSGTSSCAPGAWQSSPT